MCASQISYHVADRHAACACHLDGRIQACVCVGTHHSTRTEGGLIHTVATFRNYRVFSSSAVTLHPFPVAPYSARVMRWSLLDSVPPGRNRHKYVSPFVCCAVPGSSGFSGEALTRSWRFLCFFIHVQSQKVKGRGELVEMK